MKQRILQFAIRSILIFSIVAPLYADNPAVTINVDANVPTNLTGKVSGTTVTLNWKDNSNNEESFYIERKSKNVGTFPRVGQVGANVNIYSQTVGTYLYRVQAFNSSTGKVSAYSNQVQVRVR